MSTISSAYDSYKEGCYAEAFLRANHSCDLIGKIMQGSLTCFGVDASNDDMLNDPKNKGKVILALFLIPAIPGIVSSTLAFVKDTLLTIAYLASTVILALGALLTFGQISLVNRMAKTSAILLLDSTCNLGIDVIGIFCPYGSLQLSIKSRGTFSNLLKA